MTLGQKVKSLRVSKGFTQVQLGQKCMLDHTSISRIESDKFTPKGDTLVRLAAALDVDPLSLIYIDIIPQENTTAERIKRIVEYYSEKTQQSLLDFLESNLSDSFKL